MSAILFGSISTVADTSELQRQAFNEAFAAHGLDWNWDRDTYRKMLSASGGEARITDYAKTRGEVVDAAAVHSSKSELFQKSLASVKPAARPGVIDTIRAAKGRGWKLGLVTTTSPANVTSLLDALTPDVQRQDFDVIVDSSVVDSPKPDGAAYTFALAQLSQAADDCVAIEDNVDGVGSAVAAGVTCVAFPNENTVNDELAGAGCRVDHLDVDVLQRLLDAR